MTSTKSPNIKIGICMAGAVSAGAYTAGVTDYIIETLERWQIQKDSINIKIENGETLTDLEKLVPLYDVSIDVLSGASAGGMTAAVMGYSFLDKTFINRDGNGKLIEESYNYPSYKDQKSKLYECWVEMADDDKSTSISKMLETDDVVSIEQLESLFNCKIIEEIAAKAAPKFYPKEVCFPKYVSKNLAIYLTVSNLEGIPVDIAFDNTTEARNQFRIHNSIFGFTFGKVEREIYPCYHLDQGNYAKLINVGIATGAFPVGLRSQKITIERDELNAYIHYQKKENNLDIDIDEILGKGKTSITYNGVDGGLINNEPYGIAAKHLHRINPKTKEEINNNFMLFIDPFPTLTNVSKEEAPFPEKLTIFNIVPYLFSAVRNQSMLKQENLFSALALKKNSFLIYPSKNKLYQIACGLMGGFGGFFKKSFRIHDYQLGRKNAQAFLRYFFVRDLDFFKNVDATLSEEQVKLFSINKNFMEPELPKDLNFPLIPDLLYLQEEIKKNYSIFHGNLKRVETPIKEGLNKNEFDKITDLIKNRVSEIIKKSYPLLVDFPKKKYKKCILSFLQKPISKIVLNLSMEKIGTYLQDEFKPNGISQKDLLQYFNSNIDLNEKYIKYVSVFARVAKENELIISITSSGYETEQYATPGDYIITNNTSAKEQSVISKAVFQATYQLNKTDGSYTKKASAYVHAKEVNYGNLLDLSKGKKANVLVKENTKGRRQYYIFIETPWEESMILITGDYLVGNKEQTEVIRIGKQEFEETYEKS